MLNRAARYYPILRAINGDLGPASSVLEIGSGPYGVGEFCGHRFVGCDITFSERPRRPMAPVRASGSSLPFSDRCFDIVIASDVLEHVAPEARASVIAEALRVTRLVAVFCFPSGDAALQVDQQLWNQYGRRNQLAPDWLQEHLRGPFPHPSLFAHIGPQYERTTFGNENLSFHAWMMRREMSWLWKRLLLVLLSVLPSTVERALRLADRAPFYRQFVVVRRTAGRQLTDRDQGSPSPIVPPSGPRWLR